MIGIIIISYRQICEFYIWRYPFQFPEAFNLIGVQYDIGKRPVELKIRLCDVSHLLFTNYSSVYADYCPKVSSHPTKVRVADSEQAWLSVGHHYFATANPAVGAKAILAYHQFNQPRELETHAHRTCIAHLDLVRQR